MRAALVLAIAAGLACGGIVYATRKCPSVDRQKFESLHHAAADVTGAATAGVNLLTFAGKVQSLTTELLIAKGRPQSDRERQMVAAYEAALKAYGDALTLWTEKVKDSQYDFYDGGIAYYESSPTLKRIVDEWPDE